MATIFTPRIRPYRQSTRGVEEMGDGWTLRPTGGRPTVQYEHTLVATRRGPVVMTLVD